jgi:hypothetical protein
VSTSRDARGWYAEFRIPFATLRYGNMEEAIWGFNVMRRIRRFNEESYWAPIDRQFNIYRVSAAGDLRGLEVPLRRQATLIPYALQSAQRNYVLGETEYGYPGEVGGDAKVQVTQGLTLDLTLNTDFAQVEVDDQQLNLTRFSLFFPEKRPFFLENAGYFQVGTGGSELFFSRRIGIDQGTQVPIRGGGRLSGRAAGMNVGLLHIQTGNGASGVPGLDEGEGDAFSVVRVARELPNRSLVGAFFGDRRGRGVDGDWNRTYAVDGQVGIGSGLTVSSFLATTDTPDRDGRDHAFHLGSVYESRELRVMASYREMGEDFNPEVGFVNRRDYRTWSGFVMTYHRPGAIAWLRELRPHVSYNTFRNLDTGFEQSARLHVDVHVEMENGAFFSPAFDWVREGLVNPFTIADGVVVAPGTYDGWTAAWRFNTDLSAPFSFDGGDRLGGLPLRDPEGRLRHRELPLRLLRHPGAPGGPQPGGAAGGGLHGEPGVAPGGVLLHPPDLPPVAGPVLRPGGYLVRQRPLRLAGHRRDRPLRGAEHGPGLQHPGGSPGPLLHHQVQPPVQHLGGVTGVPPWEVLAQGGPVAPSIAVQQGWDRLTPSAG